jgi:hypothetical protein
MPFQPQFHANFQSSRGSLAASARLVMCQSMRAKHTLRPAAAQTPGHAGRLSATGSPPFSGVGMWRSVG